MSVNDDNFTHPDGATNASFTAQEWERAQKAIQGIKDRLAARCHHIIQGGAVVVKQKLSRKAVAEQLRRLDEKLKAAEREAKGFRNAK